MAAAIKIDALRCIPLLGNLNESELRQIADVVRVRSFAPDEYVLRQGDHSRDLWIVLEGQCQVVRRIDPDQRHGREAQSLTLAVLEPYSHFGEMSFFAEAPHSADVRARSQVKLLQITHADYADMIHEGIWAAFKLAYNVVQELAERLRRMDEWVAELASHSAEAAQLPEWSRFRDKLFNGWSL